MPIRVSSLAANRATVKVTWGEETFAVTYRPNAYTPDIEEELQNATAKGTATATGLNLLVALIESWEVLEPDETMVPLTTERLRSLPSPFLAAVMTAIIADFTAPKAKASS